MKRKVISNIFGLILAASLGFMACENYMISHMAVSGSNSGYIVTVFGNNFLYN